MRSRNRRSISRFVALPFVALPFVAQSQAWQVPEARLPDPGDGSRQQCAGSGDPFDVDRLLGEHIGQRTTGNCAGRGQHREDHGGGPVEIGVPRDQRAGRRKRTGADRVGGLHHGIGCLPAGRAGTDRDQRRDDRDHEVVVRDEDARHVADHDIADHAPADGRDEPEREQAEHVHVGAQADGDTGDRERGDPDTVSGGDEVEQCHR